MATPAETGGSGRAVTTAQPARRGPAKGLRQQLAEAATREAELLIENGQLRGELGEANAARAERDAAHEQLAATAEILRLIAAGPADPQRVFDAVTMSAMRLLGHSVTLSLREGETA